MASPDDPTARQPYHTVEGLPISEAAKRLAAYETSASTMAQRAITTIAGRLADGGQELRWVSILESAGRKGSSLAATLASHALIHTADGDHFRTALAGAAEKCGLSVYRVAARTLEAEAAAALGRPPSVVRDVIQGLGRDIGPPWAADQKAAALVAWVALLNASRGRRTRGRS